MEGVFSMEEDFRNSFLCQDRCPVQAPVMPYNVMHQTTEPRGSRQIMSHSPNKLKHANHVTLAPSMLSCDGRRPRKSRDKKCSKAKQKQSRPSPASCLDGISTESSCETPDSCLDLAYFKVLPCKNSTQIHNRKVCPYYHNLRDKRRSPITYQPDQCENHFDLDSVMLKCPKGDDCSKSHNRHELLYHPGLYKQRFCSQYKPSLERMTTCARGKQCAFAHSREEIRAPLFDLMEEFRPTTAFFILKFKTLWCPYGVQHDWHRCVYAHTYQDCRRSPEIGYGSEPCPFWNKEMHSSDYEKRCPNGSRCPYSHGSKEQLYHPCYYKTMPCVDFRAKGYCPRSKLCAFFHDPNERRMEIMSPNVSYGKRLASSKMKNMQIGFLNPPLFNLDDFGSFGNSKFSQTSKNMGSVITWDDSMSRFLNDPVVNNEFQKVQAPPGFPSDEWKLPIKSRFETNDENSNRWVNCFPDWYEKTEPLSALSSAFTPIIGTSLVGTDDNSFEKRIRSDSTPFSAWDFRTHTSNNGVNLFGNNKSDICDESFTHNNSAFLPWIEFDILKTNASVKLDTSVYIWNTEAQHSYNLALSLYRSIFDKCCLVVEDDMSFSGVYDSTAESSNISVDPNLNFDNGNIFKICECDIMFEKLSSCVEECATNLICLHTSSHSITKLNSYKRLLSSRSFRFIHIMEMVTWIDITSELLCSNPISIISLPKWKRALFGDRCFYDVKQTCESLFMETESVCRSKGVKVIVVNPLQNQISSLKLTFNERLNQTEVSRIAGSDLEMLQSICLDSCGRWEYTNKTLACTTARFMRQNVSALAVTSLLKEITRGYVIDCDIRPIREKHFRGNEPDSYMISTPNTSLSLKCLVEGSTFVLNILESLLLDSKILDSLQTTGHCTAECESTSVELEKLEPGSPLTKLRANSEICLKCILCGSSKDPNSFCCFVDWKNGGLLCSHVVHNECANQLNMRNKCLCSYFFDPQGPRANLNKLVKLLFELVFVLLPNSFDDLKPENLLIMPVLQAGRQEDEKVFLYSGLMYPDAWDLKVHFDSILSNQKTSGTVNDYSPICYSLSRTLLYCFNYSAIPCNHLERHTEFIDSLNSCPLCYLEFFWPELHDFIQILLYPRGKLKDNPHSILTAHPVFWSSTSQMNFLYHLTGIVSQFPDLFQSSDVYCETGITTPDWQDNIWAPFRRILLLFSKQKKTTDCWSSIYSKKHDRFSLCDFLQSTDGNIIQFTLETFVKALLKLKKFWVETCQFCTDQEILFLHNKLRPNTPHNLFSDMEHMRSELLALGDDVLSLQLNEVSPHLTIHLYRFALSHSQIRICLSVVQELEEVSKAFASCWGAL